MKKSVFTGKKSTVAKKYDTALFRLSMILQMLINDERPTIAQLVEEFGVSKRTVQEDIYTRLGSFSIKKDTLGRLYFEDDIDIKKSVLRIEEVYLLSLSLSQVERIDAQHEQLARSVFKKILKRELYNPYFIKPESFQPIDDDEELIDTLEYAITDRRAIELVFNRKPLKLFPYKIASFEGIWYLLADDVYEDKLKNYMIAKIEHLRILDERFERMSELEQMLEQIQSSWFDEGTTFRVTVKVYKEIADYFRLKKHLDSQEIVKEHDDGALTVAFTVTHDEDVDNLIKSWLPHIEVLSPERFRRRIINELQEYLEKIT